MITMVSGEITLKDQLNEYKYCGKELTEMSLFTFVLDTYDMKADQVDGIRGDQHCIDDLAQRTSGRPPNR